MGSEEVTLAAAEHACSAPKPEVECQSAKCTCSTDAPEGAVVDLKEGVRVRPKRRSGPKWGKPLNPGWKSCGEFNRKGSNLASDRAI